MRISDWSSDVCSSDLDTGMNRLGLDWRGDIPARLAGLEIATLMSHLACADEDGPLSPAQLERFSALRGQVKAARYSLANSAGICMALGCASRRVRLWRYV